MRCLRVIILFLLVWGGKTVDAQEIALDGFAGIGSRAMGMGGAFVSVGDDYSSTFWNPAGLARANRGTVYWEATHGRFENQSRFFGSPATYDLSSTRIGAIGVVIPYPVHQGSLVFAGGFGRNKDFDNGLEISGYDTVVDYDKKGFSEDRGALGAWTLGGAMDMAPNLSVGLSLYRWRGFNQFDQELTLADVQNVHPDTVRFYQRYASQDRYTAWGIQGGLLYWHTSGFRMGLTVAATTPLRVSSNLEDEFEDEFVTGTDIRFNIHLHLHWVWAMCVARGRLLVMCIMAICKRSPTINCPKCLHPMWMILDANIAMRCACIWVANICFAMWRFGQGIIATLCAMWVGEMCRVC